MKVICTKTGECEKGGGFNSLHCLNGTEQWEQEHYASCPYRVRTGLAEVIELIPRAEALRIARETLEKAEKERAEIAMSVALSLGDEAEEYAAAFDSLIACYEELAEAHRLGNDIYQALMRVRIEEVQPECPGPGWYWVRGHWRSRAQNSAAIDPDQGTVQAAPGEGQTGASGEATGHSPEGADPQIRDAYCRGRSGIPLGNWCNESQSGDATGADKEQPCPGCGSYRGTHGLGCRILSLTQSGEERSE